MKDESKLQKMFREDMTTNKTEEKFTGSKAVMIISMIGISFSSFLFGYSLYNHLASQAVLFGLMILVCASAFINNNRIRKNK